MLFDSKNLNLCLLFEIGFPEAQEYLNQVLGGINQVIKTHMNDLHLKFENQFASMACEVRRRDAMIAQLQKKLRSVEMKTLPTSTLTRRKHNRERISQQLSDDIEPKSEENSSSGSSAELLFMV